MWAHRGFFKDGLQQNSIESFVKAFDLGVLGVELDIFYDLKTDEYIVSHDYPYNLKNGHILKLEEVFTKVSKRGYFWLDFKNLAILSKHDTQKATVRLRNLLRKYNLAEKSIVESTNPINLSICSKSGLYTSFWITPYIINEQDYFFAFWYNIYRYKLIFLYGNFSAISMDHFLFSKQIEKIFSDIPIHLFTVNDKRRLTELIAKDNVKVVLSDEKENYLENNCTRINNTANPVFPAINSDMPLRKCYSELLKIIVKLKKSNI